MNPVEIEEAVSDLAREPFDRAEFPFQFLAAFDNPETTIKRLRSGSTNQSDITGGVLQRNNIHIATCDVGAVDETLKALRDSPKTASAKAKFILATDGEAFQTEDLNGGGTVACTYAEFPDHFGFFLPLAGITTVKEIRESSFDVKATGRLNRLYIQLLKENPDWAKAERQHDINHFMARLIFCFFAEDTDIFLSEGLFTKTVEQMSAGDAASTHTVIGEIFRAMDTKPADRGAAGLPRYAVKFPYVNGQLFSGSTDVPRFSKVARSYLMHIGRARPRSRQRHPPRPPSHRADRPQAGPRSPEPWSVHPRDRQGDRIQHGHGPTGQTVDGPGRAGRCCHRGGMIACMAESRLEAT